MAIGVAVANAILLVTFAERNRLHTGDALRSAIHGGRERLRPILMTSCAMIAGMVPMALGLGEGGEQSAPLGRAVIGGLAVATGATLLILPAVFSVVMGGSQAAAEWAKYLPLRLRFLVLFVVGQAKIGSPSLHPDDADSAYYAPEVAVGANYPHGHEPAPAHEEPPHEAAQPNVPDAPPQTGLRGGSPHSPETGPHNDPQTPN
jgi:hypothetical protein